MTTTSTTAVATSLADLAAGQVLDLTRLYIDGEWVTSEGTDRIEVVNPATEQVVAEVVDGTASDVDRAVAAATAAFPAWSARPAAERADYLAKTAALLTERLDDLAHLVSYDIGSPIAAAKAVQFGLPIFNFGYYAELARSYDFEGTELGNSLIVKEPIGIVGCITPWNFPVHQVALKVAGAFAAGCTDARRCPHRCGQAQ